MLTVFSDLHCPWAYLFSIRLRRARTAVGEPPVAWRCWPLELVNERGTPWETLSQEIPVLTQLEPDHFAPPRRETWPSTLLPAMEGLKVAGELGGPAAADRFDEAARRAFFLTDGTCRSGPSWPTSPPRPASTGPGSWTPSTAAATAAA